MKKAKSFMVPGMHHKLSVDLVSAGALAKALGRKKPEYRGYYDSNSEAIFIDENLPLEVKKHTLFHEISHAILDVLSGMKGEEDKCDVLGAYLFALVEAREEIYRGLNKK